MSFLLLLLYFSRSPPEPLDTKGQDGLGSSEISLCRYSTHSDKLSKDRSAILLRQWTAVALFFLTLVSFQLFTRLHLCSIVYMQLRFKSLRGMSCCGLKQSHTKKCQFVQQCKLHMTRPNIRDDTERVTTVKVVTVVII